MFPLATQDITPYGNDVHHLNSVLQPCTAPTAPVVGVAITAETMVQDAPQAAHAADLEEAARFMLEVAKAFGRGQCSYDKGVNMQDYRSFWRRYEAVCRL